MPRELLPYIILNIKTVPKENFCKHVIVQSPKNAWITSELMEDWFGWVLKCRAGALGKPRSMLAMDAFRDHLSNRIRNR
jgi:hypothetical protein